MIQFGSKDSKRHFTVVMAGKEHGLYVSSTPSSAARNAVTKLCAANKSKKVEFSIREITQGSKKKTYGPYVGHIEKLNEPIELKGRVIRYKPVAKLNGKANKKTVVKKKGVQKGGKIYTGDYEIIFEGPDDILGLIDDNELEHIFYTLDLSVEITKESNKIIFKLKNIKNEETWLLEAEDFLKEIFTTLEYWINYRKHESRNKLLDDISKIKVYFKKYYFENKNSKRITTFTETDLFNKIRRFKIAFFTMDNDDIGYNFLCAIKKELKKIYNISDDLIGIQKKILGYYRDLFYVIDDYTTLTEKDIIKELKELVRSKVYMSAAVKYQKKIDEKIEAIENSFNKSLYLQYLLEFNLLRPILIDESGNEIMINWE
jgi:hypothetical protein